MTQVKTHIKQEVGAAKQYTHSLFNNLKLELNPQINQIAEQQSKLELQFHQNHNLPTPDPFASTPHQSKSQQLINADFMPSNIATPASHKASGNGRPSRNLHSENWLPDFVGGGPQPMPNVDHNVSSHVNEETLQLAAMGPNILMASITQAQLANTKIQIASKITTFDGKQSNYRKWVQDIEQQAKLNNLDPSDLAACTSADHVSEFVNSLKSQVSWPELKKHLAKEYGHIIDEQDAQYKLNNIQKQPGQQMQQYIQDIDDIITHITDKPESIDSQAKSAFIQGIGDDQLIRNLLNKPTTFTY